MKRLQQNASQTAALGAKKTKTDDSEPEGAVFGDLPEDVLTELFERITSLPLRFSLAGVNRKFRKIMLREIGKPMALHLKWEIYVWCINGHKIPPRKWPVAIGVLAEKTQFTEINIICGQAQISYGIYSALLSSLPSLDKLVKFECDAKYTSKWCPNQVLKLLKNSPKLSILKLDISKYFNQSQLKDALANRALTEIDIKIEVYNQQQFLDLFRCIQPLTLRKLTLVIDFEGLVWEKGFGGVFEMLEKDAWVQLETISLDFGGRLYEIIPDDDGFFKNLGKLAKLQKCSFTMDYRLQREDLARYIAVFLKHSGPSPRKREFECRFYRKHSGPSPHKRIFECRFYRIHDFANSRQACYAVDALKNVQTALPNVEFSFEIAELARIGQTVSISFTLQNATFKLAEMRLIDCRCNTCRGFYPIIVMKLKSKAKQFDSGHWRAIDWTDARLGDW